MRSKLIARIALVQRN